jgi:hypothetical protein
MEYSLPLKNSSSFDMVNFFGEVKKKGGMLILPKKTNKTLKAEEKKLDKAQRLFLSGMKIMENFLQKGINPKVSALDVMSTVYYCREVVKVSSLDEIQKGQIRQLFSILAILPPQRFDRKKALGDQVQLQRILSEDLDKLMLAQEKDPSLAENKEHRFSVTLAKAELAYHLGVKMKETGKGANGAAFVMGLENKPLGVFKAPAKLGMKEKVKLVFGQARLLNLEDSLGREFSEVAAAKFDAIFGFGFAPEAKMMEIGSKKGAFLEFLGGYKELSAAKRILQHRKSFTAQETIMWQKMCLHNFLIGNMDPHDENIFVEIDIKGILQKIAVIDHGNSFIESNPGALGAKGNQGHWGKYKLSNAKFHPEVLQFIKKQLDQEHVEEFIKWVKAERAEFWNDKMEIKMRERFALMKDILSGSIATPEKLSGIHTNDDFKKHL